jgi:hypothetical protein
MSETKNLMTLTTLILNKYKKIKNYPPAAAVAVITSPNDPVVPS